MNTTYQTPALRACGPVTQTTAEMITWNQGLSPQVNCLTLNTFYLDILFARVMRPHGTIIKAAPGTYWTFFLYPLSSDIDKISPI